MQIDENEKQLFILVATVNISVLLLLGTLEDFISLLPWALIFFDQIHVNDVYHFQAETWLPVKDCLLLSFPIVAFVEVQVDAEMPLIKIFWDAEPTCGEKLS